MSGGLAGLVGKDDEVIRAAPAGAFALAQAERGEEHRSSTIDALIARRSILPEGLPHDRVADAVLSASPPSPPNAMPLASVLPGPSSSLAKAGPTLTCSSANTRPARAV